VLYRAVVRQIGGTDDVGLVLLSPGHRIVRLIASIALWTGPRRTLAIRCKLAQKTLINMTW